MSKGKLISDEGSKQLSKLLIYFITPIAVLFSFLNMEYDEKHLLGLLIAFLISFGSLVLSALISRLIFGMKNGIEHFGTSFPNGGFLGIPLVMALLGPMGVFYISPFVALLNVFQFTYGIYVITGNKRFIQFKKIITNPFVIAFVLGTIFYLLKGVNFSLPLIVNEQFSIVSKMLGPVAMIIIGTYLANANLKQALKDPLLYKALSVRHLIIPIITALIFLLIPSNYNVITLAVMVVVAAPVGANTAIFSALYNIPQKNAIPLICISTLLSLFTMPLMIYFYQFLIG
jgi:predicted permease